METERAWTAFGKSDVAIWAVETMHRWLEDFVSNLGIGLAVIATELLPPTLFPPTQLKTVLRHVKSVLPPGWSLTSALQLGDLWKAFQDARVVAAAP